MWDTVILVIFLLCCVGGVLLTALRLPGTWLIVAAALGYAWWADWKVMGPGSLGILTVLALVGELVEAATSGLAARRAGATPQAAWGAVIGGIVGMLTLASALSLPLPVVGTLIGAVGGAMLGCFCGAVGVEFALRGSITGSTRVGLFSAAGFVIGLVAKIGVALAMTGLIVCRVILSHVDGGV